MEYNMYCDESCHLEHDRINSMVIGGIWCPKSKARLINRDIVKIKAKYNVSEASEIKWTSVGPVKAPMYLELLNYFFDNDDLHYRGILIKDKSKLNHEKHNQTHNDWYYKMYYDMIKVIINPFDSYFIYLDYKDTHSYYRCKQLHMYLCKYAHDVYSEVIQNVQPIKSHEVQIMQITDVITGAIAYSNRRFDPSHKKSAAKIMLADLIKERSGSDLSSTSRLTDQKFNVFAWEPNYFSGGIK